MDAKDQWQTGFEAHIRDLDSRKPVIWAGDLNVAPTPRDLFHPKTNWNKTAGYTEIECSWFAKFLRGPGSETTTTTTSADADAAVAAPSSGKFIDVWRKMNPKLKHFTYFSMMRKCREKGIGWRLDMCTSSHCQNHSLPSLVGPRYPADMPLLNNLICSRPQREAVLQSQDLRDPIRDLRCF